ncbi:hypothetical protein RND71_037980 [Anisodus tanguticus]|uniref:Uncharacterized protein n=1 Tax=Anisodus tanguticus TaxID=243964 RepID=A0AAE1QY61_9SOLA|nr:hypothetical protein RND71_037980 [Anisodus tanguticus]
MDLVDTNTFRSVHRKEQAEKTNFVVNHRFFWYPSFTPVLTFKYCFACFQDMNKVNLIVSCALCGKFLE